MLATPEDRNRPSIASATDAEANAVAARCRPPENLAELLADPAAFARHTDWIDMHTARRPGERDPALAVALLKLSDGLGIPSLEPAETYAVMTSMQTLGDLASQRRGAM